MLESRGHDEDEHRSERPSTLKTDKNIACANTFVRSDRRLKLRMLCELFYLNRFTVHQICTLHLHMEKDSAKIEHIEDRKTFFDLHDRTIINQYSNRHVIAGDESWSFEYDLEINRQTKKLHAKTSPRLKKGQMNKSNI